jgi:hypothetical protein
MNLKFYFLAAPFVAESFKSTAPAALPILPYGNYVDQLMPPMHWHSSVTTHVISLTRAYVTAK